MMTEHGHIGDGVYVSDDGYQIWLAANNHNNKVVALEPRVFMELVKTAGKVFEPTAYADALRKAADELDAIYGT